MGMRTVLLDLDVLDLGLSPGSATLCVSASCCSEVEMAIRSHKDLVQVK